jgi:hypothetical protein
MDWFITAITALGAVLLPVAGLLLLEELTFGGLVRLLLAPRPESSGRSEPKRVNGDGKCLR